MTKKTNPARHVVCSLYPKINSDVMSKYPEGIIIWSGTVEDINAFLNREKIQGLCETVDSGFYTQEDSHIRIINNRVQYKDGFMPFWN